MANETAAERLRSIFTASGSFSMKEALALVDELERAAANPLSARVDDLEASVSELRGARRVPPPWIDLVSARTERFRTALDQLCKDHSVALDVYRFCYDVVSPGSYELMAGVVDAAREARAHSPNAGSKRRSSTAHACPFCRAIRRSRTRTAESTGHAPSWRV